MVKEEIVGDLFLPAALSRFGKVFWLEINGGGYEFPF